MTFEVMISDEAKKEISQSADLARQDLTAQAVSQSLATVLNDKQVYEAVAKLAKE
ncbi:hypothetical protein [Lacticaseibacillus daqingensis]|uniref:hypothetical protein n=1 Tax=Lacticaseibacillus daqingensis TaxID=2486014 RepID=UPI0013DD926A|nr:hypothetical protein [Lacticaseibacillus daqingensis]